MRGAELSTHPLVWHLPLGSLGKEPLSVLAFMNPILRHHYLPIHCVGSLTLNSGFVKPSDFLGTYKLCMAMLGVTVHKFLCDSSLEMYTIFPILKIKVTTEILF